MDPISTLVLAGAVGGASGKLAEKAWDSAGKWLGSFFQDHNENAKQKATENSLDFLVELATRVKLLEENNKVPADVISNAQDQPDFSALLQKAILASSQTESKEKHKILAEIVSTRLEAETESIYSLSTKLACDAVTYATSSQLRILGLATAFRLNYPEKFSLSFISSQITESNKQDDLTRDQQIKEWGKDVVEKWLLKRLKPFQDAKVTSTDIFHLQSLSCVFIQTKMRFVGGSNPVSTVPMFSIPGLFDFNELSDEALRDSIIEAWNEGLDRITLTTVGELIGVSVLNALTGLQMHPSFWDE